MTAPLKHPDTTIVDVALGDRAYDIVIGRDVLKSLGARVAALRALAVFGGALDSRAPIDGRCRLLYRGDWRR